jgi:hypothetical protein
MAAGVGQGQRNGLADTMRAAGDDGYLAAKIHVSAG